MDALWKNLSFIEIVSQIMSQCIVLASSSLTRLGRLTVPTRS